MITEITKKRREGDFQAVHFFVGLPFMILMHLFTNFIFHVLLRETQKVMSPSFSACVQAIICVGEVDISIIFHLFTLSLHHYESKRIGLRLFSILVIELLFLTIYVRRVNMSS